MWTIVIAILIALFIWKVILPALFYLGLFGTLRVAGSARRKEQQQTQSYAKYKELMQARQDTQYKDQKLREFGNRFKDQLKSDERLISLIWK